MSEAPNWIIMPFIDCWDDYTKAAASDALEQTVDPRLLLIDNGSKRSARLAAEDFHRTAPVGKGHAFLLWRHAPPLPSIAATWNRALDFVWEVGGEHALVVNNDVRFHPHTYVGLLRARERYDPAPLFVTAVGVDEKGWQECGWDPKHPTETGMAFRGDLESTGGPDFSCYLISKACHEKYRFDENFVPAYHEDLDYHRRMMLAGDGDRIFSINVPFLHYASKTINRDEKTKREWAPKFERCREYYVKKWGGVGPADEKFLTPFGEDEPSGGAEHTATQDLQAHGCTGCRHDDDTRSGHDAAPAESTP